MNLIEQVHEKKILILLEIYEEVQLRILQEKDVTDKYVNWMNDYEVVKFTEQHSIIILSTIIVLNYMNHF